MQIIDCDMRNRQAPAGSKIIALGNFDGLHRGHQALIREAVLQSKKEGALSACLLFKHHTTALLSDHSQCYLTSVEDKIALLDQFGIDVVFLKEFDQKFRSLTKEDFIENVLKNQLHASCVIVGNDFRFGVKAQGTVWDLKKAQENHRLNVSVVDDVLYQGKRISSTRIREAVLAGRVEEAGDMLGRPFQLSGRVVHGSHRGQSKLNFPTANLELHFPYVLPTNGVYLTEVFWEDEHAYGMTDIGTNPTFTDQSVLKIETHIFDFHGDLYGKNMRLNFLRFERRDIKFRCAEELSAQMKEDQRILMTWILEEKERNGKIAIPNKL